MKSKTGVIFIWVLLAMWCPKPAWALVHTQRDGLFNMDVPAGWHWIDYPQEVVITYPDGQTMAMDIQIAPSLLSASQARQSIKQSNDKMIKEGIEAHGGILLDNIETTLGGAYAARLDFETSPAKPVSVTYISCFNKGYAFSITYGSNDQKIHAVMDDAVATFQFK